MSGPASRRSEPTANRARSATRAGANRPSATPPHFPSPASADTTSPRWQRSPQTASPSLDTSDPTPPSQPHDPEGLSNRVSPLMLAPNPSQHLESEKPIPGNPL